MTLPKQMTIKEATKNVGGLSKVSKMPSLSWSISALDCSTGTKLRESKQSTVCDGCYALKGMQSLPTQQNAYARRLELWRTNRKLWLLSMDYLLKNKKEIQDTKYFRWFDSGDIQGAEMFQDLITLANLNPLIKFWLPTKEFKLVKIYANQIPSNLNVRKSHPLINAYKMQPMNNITESYVYDGDKLDTIPNDTRVCPATKPNSNGQCNDCRMCWDNSIKSITYIKH